MQKQAQELLAIVRAQRGLVEDALAKANTMSGTRLRLDSVLSELIGAESELSGSNRAAGTMLDLSRLAQMLQSIQAGALASQAITEAASSTAKAAAAAQLVAVSADCRRAVQSVERDIFERKIFDPYLRFSSAEDEAAYRQREAENRRAIAAELAKHTPAGDLQANAITIRQLSDAGVHGADKSPEFAARLAEVDASFDKQRSAMLAAGQGTAAADRVVDDSAHGYLKSKARSDMAVDTAFAGSGRTTALSSSHSNSGSTSATGANRPDGVSQGCELPSLGAVGAGGAADQLGDVLAALKTAGIRTHSQSSETVTHGLPVQRASAADGPGRG